MPRIAVEDNSRMSLRIRAEEKALLFQDWVRPVLGGSLSRTTPPGPSIRK